MKQQKEMRVHRKGELNILRPVIRLKISAKAEYVTP
jgi:hypothetical protein